MTEDQYSLRLHDLHHCGTDQLATARFQVLFGNTDLLELVLLELSLLDIIFTARVCRSWHSIITTSPALQAALFLRPLPARHVAALNAAYRHKSDTLDDDQHMHTMRCMTASRKVTTSETIYEENTEQPIRDLAHDIIRAEDAVLNPVFSHLLPESATPLTTFTTRHGYLQGSDPARQERIARNEAAAQIWSGQRANNGLPPLDHSSGTASPLFHLFAARRDDTFRALKDLPLQPRWTRCPELWRRMYVTQPPSVVMTLATCKGWWGWEFSDITEPAFEVSDESTMLKSGKRDERPIDGADEIKPPRGVTIGTILDWLQRNEGKLRKGYILASSPPKLSNTDTA